MVEEIKKTGVGALTHQTVRRDIIVGKLPGGTKLKMSFLKEQYDASGLVLRNVLHSLSDEGFVVAQEQKGFYVAPLAEKKLQELADLRYLLESHMMETSFSRSTLEWESCVLATHHKLQGLEKRYMDGQNSTKELFELKLTDYDFHCALISGCDSEELLSVHKTVFDKYFRYLFHYDAFRGLQASQEHKCLAESALSKDIHAAKEILKTHIYECVQTISNPLQKR